MEARLPSLNHVAEKDIKEWSTVLCLVCPWSNRLWILIVVRVYIFIIFWLAELKQYQIHRCFIQMSNLRRFISVLHKCLWDKFRQSWASYVLSGLCCDQLSVIFPSQHCSQGRSLIIQETESVKSKYQSSSMVMFSCCLSAHWVVIFSSALRGTEWTSRHFVIALLALQG